MECPPELLEDFSLPLTAPCCMVYKRTNKHLEMAARCLKGQYLRNPDSTNTSNMAAVEPRAKRSSLRHRVTYFSNTQLNNASFVQRRNEGVTFRTSSL